MPETITFDHYEVLTRDDGSLYELGRGAMGITYKAFDTNLRVPVALKVINGTYLDSEVARQRFAREARSAAKLRHRNVASVFHLGTGESWFYAMEYIDGETLEALIKRQGPLHPLLALQITDQVARALNAAQQVGLVHRDIKPSNLMLVREDDELIVKVIDFGLAKTSLPGEEDAVTITVGGFVGTPHFASPEQLEEREIDVRSDIYSLGVTLWYMLAGQAPFGGSMAQVMSQHLSKPPPFEQFTNLPEPLAALLRKMLEKDAASRPQTPSELRKEIEACLAQIADSPEAVASAVADEENFATLLEDVSNRAAESAWESGATIAGRYRITESRGETNSGRIFRAYDSQRQRDVRLLLLKPELVETPTAYTQVERDVEKIAPVQHPNLLQLYGFETIDGSSYLAMEWTDGFTLLELLRARRELCAGEALPLLAEAAAGADAALAAGLLRVDFALHQVRVHFAGEFDKEKLLRAPVTDWPAFTVKLNPLGITQDLSRSATWAGGQTMVGGMPARGAKGEDERTRYVQALAAIFYEVLGGALPPSGGLSAKSYTPLATLSEEGNAVLKRALDPATSFPSAENFHRALAGIDVLEVKRHEPRPAAKPPLARQPATLPPLPPPAKKRLPLAFLGGIGTLLAIGGAVWYFAQFGEDPGPANVATPAPATPVAEATPSPVEKPVVTATPSPVTKPIATATPSPIPPKPPTPSRKEMLTAGLADGEQLEAAERWPEALDTYLRLAKEYPESDTGRVHLEMMLGRITKLPKGLPPEAYAAMKDELAEAAQLDVVAAMMLIAETVREREPVTAFNWMSAAAAKGNIDALTQLGLMLSNGAGCEKDLSKAVACFQEAAEKGDPAAKAALGECYLNGKGIAKDEKRAIELLREASDAGDVRAMNRLGDCNHKGIGVPKNFDEAFRLFEAASKRGFPEAMGNLGVLYINGEGVSASETKAVELFQKAARAGHPHSMYLLAQCLDSGTGTGANKLQASGWYKKAADAGHKRAAEWCAKNIAKPAR